jgi:hypothetical protein
MGMTKRSEFSHNNMEGLGFHAWRRVGFQLGRIDFHFGRGLIIKISQFLSYF